jgi:hypothetical protein
MKAQPSRTGDLRREYGGLKNCSCAAQRSFPVAYFGPTELAVFRALGDEHHAGAGPEQQLTRSARAEHVDTGKGSGAHRLAHQAQGRRIQRERLADRPF